MTGFLNNPSGGWRYHLRALRYGNALWPPYKEHVATFLKQWAPNNDELIIVGPSAGYSLPLKWLQRFRSIEVLEPDLVARTLFTWRASRAGVKGKLNSARRIYLLATLRLNHFTNI